MNILFKLIIGATIATGCSILFGLIAIIFGKIITELFYLNYQKNDYWILTYSFYGVIIIWIISFGLSLIFIDTV